MEAPARWPTEPDPAYQDRAGYDARFLGPAFPVVPPARADLIELRYHHFTAWVHPETGVRLAALNVDGGRLNDRDAARSVRQSGPMDDVDRRWPDPRLPAVPAPAGMSLAMPALVRWGGATEAGLAEIDAHHLPVAIPPNRAWARLGEQIRALVASGRGGTRACILAGVLDGAPWAVLYTVEYEQLGRRAWMAPAAEDAPVEVPYRELAVRVGLIAADETPDTPPPAASGLQVTGLHAIEAVLWDEDERVATDALAGVLRTLGLPPAERAPPLVERGATGWRFVVPAGGLAPLDAWGACADLQHALGADAQPWLEAPTRPPPDTDDGPEPALPIGWVGAPPEPRAPRAYPAAAEPGAVAAAIDQAVADGCAVVAVTCGCLPANVLARAVAAADDAGVLVVACADGFPGHDPIAVTAGADRSVPPLEATSGAQVLLLARLAAAWLHRHADALGAAFPGPWRSAAFRTVVGDGPLDPEALLATPPPDPSAITPIPARPVDLLDQVRHHVAPGRTRHDVLRALTWDAHHAERPDAWGIPDELALHLLVDAAYREVVLDRLRDLDAPTTKAAFANPSPVLVARAAIAEWEAETRSGARGVIAAPDDIDAAVVTLSSPKGGGGNALHLAPEVLLTAEYMIPTARDAQTLTARFVDGGRAHEVRLDPDRLYVRSEEPPYVLVATLPLSGDETVIADLPLAPVDRALPAVDAATELVWRHPIDHDLREVSGTASAVTPARITMVSEGGDTAGAAGAPWLRDGRVVAIDHEGVVRGPQAGKVSHTVPLATILEHVQTRRLREPWRTRLAAVGSTASMLPEVDASRVHDPDFAAGLDNTLLAWLVDPKTPQITVLVHLRDAGWQPPAYVGDDVEMLTSTSAVAPARVTPRGLAYLAASAQVLWIEASRFGVEAQGGEPMVDKPSPPSALEEVNVVRGGRRLPVTGKGVILAFLDDGIDPLHLAFRDAAGKSRLIGYWDQQDDGGPSPREALGTFAPAFGTYHTAERLQTCIEARKVPRSLRSATGQHGTHVASLAAGSAIDGVFEGGVAPDAHILAVRTDLSRGARTSSVGQSATHVLALDLVKKLAFQANMPVVVNLSQGMNAGAHDGSSLLETAFERFTGSGREPGFAIVKSAGNERGRGGHVRLLVEQNAMELLEWQTGTDRRILDRFELWFPSLNAYRFTLYAPTGPGGAPEEWAAVDHWNPVDDRHPQVTIRYERFHRDNGQSQLLLEIREQDRVIPAGRWALEIVGEEVDQGDQPIHAWIERSVGDDIRFVGDAEDTGTLTVPGTSDSVICVGAAAVAQHLRVAPFSSYGPTRDGREKPDLVAPGIDVVGARAGTLLDTTMRSGTSMAAPHVAGAIALLFAQFADRPRRVWPNAVQIRAALAASSRDNTGRWSRRRGYGRLDVAALLETLRVRGRDEQAAAMEPEPSA